MSAANYRKLNDGSQNSSTYHKKDGTNIRAKLKEATKYEISTTASPSTGEDIYHNAHSMITTITVTTEDIAKGKAGTNKECPVALAINRVLAPHFQARVRYRECDFISRDDEMPVGKANLPVNVYDWITFFDDPQSQDPTISPITFQLDIPGSILA